MKKRNFILFSLYLSITGILFLINYNVNNDFFTFLIVFLSLLYILSFQRDIPYSILVMIGFGFIFRAFYAYNTYSDIISPFPDSFQYIDNLNMIINEGKLDFETMTYHSGTSQFFYYYLMYLCFKLFNSYFSLYLINILMFSASLVIFYKLTIKEFGAKVAYVSTVIGIFSTTFLLFTSNILKDSLVVFLLVLILYLYRTKSLRKYFVFIALLIFCLTLTRIYAGFSVILGILFDTLINKSKRTKLSFKAFSAIFLSMITFLVFRYTFMSKYFDMGMKFITQSHSFLDGFLSIPRTLLLMFFSPLPWGAFNAEQSAYSILQIDSALALIFSISIPIFLIKVLKYKLLRQKMYLYLIPILFHAFTLGLAYDGSSIRQRIGVYLFIILIFTIGLLYKPNQTPVNERLTMERS